MRGNSQKIRVVITGGGSGGHIFPLIAVVSEMRLLAEERGVYPEIRYIGAPGFLRGVLEGSEIRVGRVYGAKIRRYFSLRTLVDIPLFFISIFQAMFYLFWFMPDVVFSKGGSGSFPVILAAWFYRIPVVIHESDAVPGLNNRLAARFAKQIMVAFESAEPALEKTAKGADILHAGNPIRGYFLDKQPTLEQARVYLKFNMSMPLLVFLGGSQGSMKINDFILDNLKELLSFTQIYHQTGRENYEKVVREFGIIEKHLTEEEKSRYRVVDHLDRDMVYALAAGDVVVTRAGAGAIFEVAAFGKPSILIPLPRAVTSAQQEENAREYSKIGAAVIIEEENLLPNLFVNTLKRLFEDPDKLVEMAKAARLFYKPDAGEKIAEVVLKLGGM